MTAAATIVAVLVVFVVVIELGNRVTLRRQRERNAAILGERNIR